MNAMYAALAPIPAEPWDALTAERRIVDRAPTPAGAAGREPLCDACATMHASGAPLREHRRPMRRRAYSPTHRPPTENRSISPPFRRPRNRPRHPRAQIVALTDPI
ncbi:hypothetical protein L0Z11_28580 [Burkholderia multivorans]|uniref:hypothetical protein n=1 Tax=Burkholderia multivorans TaxID=87883 RepID=UPI002018A913|nr:hypothetical protein [Burkholderia multivorans]UQN72211.1 hypothetical protein L0Z45_28545 [Burkholderia multivorans]UQN77946.1 hypothetical protein L0Z11_28580 [Burkholderia multivorans]